MRQAVAQEYVLSKLVELLLERFHAVVDAALELPHGPQGQHLDGTVQPVLAVAQEDALVLVLEVLVVDYVLLEARGHENCVRVDLHGPVVAGELPAGKDLLPHPHKNVGVQRRVVQPTNLDLQGTIQDLRADEGALVAPKGVPGPQRDGGIAVQRRGVAAEDARPLGQLRLHEVHLVRARHHQREAEQRGCRAAGRRGRGRGDLLAAPRRLLLLGLAPVHARLALLLARSKKRVLLEACHVWAAAAFAHAIVALVGAVADHPRECAALLAD
mmetsp:Transcript_1867/g.4997  ORF Transcript_1867/g.4997 Transcript_1867/m.4997 type:complete len:271 (-) Transcript_1867:702-1514(-)